VILLLFSKTPKVYAEYHSELRNVLILNSYQEGLSWTSNQTKGITEVLKQSNKNIDVLIEYMDWKNYPYEKNLRLLQEYYKYKYLNKRIDLIIATDDTALQFALNNREIFSNAPIVFSGVNHSSAVNITKGYDRVTGVLEEVYPVQTVELAQKINPSVKNIYLVFDNTESGLAMGNEINTKITKAYPKINIVNLNNMEFNDLLHTVGQLDKNSVVLMSTYMRDKADNMMEMDYAIREISSHSSVPVYHLHDFGLHNGAIGGVMLSGKLHGQLAAKLAVRILSGENPDKIPFTIPNSKMSVLDYQQMQRYHISKKQIPEGFEVINQPFSFYETYKSLVLTVLIIFTIFVIFIYILLIYIRRIQKMKKNLSENHEELAQLYEELTASDEEMKEQYDEMLLINEKIRLGEEKLTYLAYYDVLTGLPNKLSLYENAKRIFCLDGGKVALLFVDIDNFKHINDTQGHGFGDKFIQKVSEKLSEIFYNKNNIYRLSGDEFIILLQDIKDDKEAQEIASNILQNFNEEIQVQKSVLRISLSIGIAIYPDHGNRLEHLLKYADIAMYKVKENGKKNYIMYDSVMSEDFNERVHMEQYLQKALENNEFELHYQPQIDPTLNRITGFEALLRWNSPELGRVSPLKFIKVAEDTRYIIPLGTWVIKTACAFLRRIMDMGYQDLNISVNISILQLLQSDFCEIVLHTLKETGLDPKRLELEITESVLMESVEVIETKLKQLSSHNITIALDDFGKGYSSLSYLSQLPITTLKVDKSFVDSIIHENIALIGQIITLGKKMGMSIVAEGVEEKEQLEYLMQYNCDKIQGFYYSKPLPEEEVIKLLENSEDLIAATNPE
jgi:diguanylate cyclase (GGDEF) domain